MQFTRVLVLAGAASVVAVAGAQPDWSMRVPLHPQSSPTLGMVAMNGDRTLLVQPDRSLILDSQLRPVDVAVTGNTQIAPLPLRDGGLLIGEAINLRGSDYSCVLRRLDVQMNVMWKENLYQGSSGFSQCRALAEDADGDIWAIGPYLTRLGVDGSQRLRFDSVEAHFVARQLVAAPGIADVIALGTFSLVDASGAFVDQPGVAAIDDAGRIRWRWQDPTRTTQFTAIQHAGDGAVLLQGLDGADGMQRAVLVLLDAQGQLRWRWRDELSGLQNRSLVFALRGDGAVAGYGPGPLAGQTSLLLVDRQGREVWRRVDALADGVRLDAFRLVPGNSTDVLLSRTLLTGVSGSLSRQYDIARIDGLGAPVWRRSVAGGLSNGSMIAPQMRALPDGSMLANGFDTGLQRYGAADGTSVGVDSASTLLDAPDGDLLAVDAAGNTALIRSDRRLYRLLALDPLGRLRWEQADSARRPLALTTGPTRTCQLAREERIQSGQTVGTDAELTCHDAIHGALLWSTRLVAGSLPQRLAHGERADGTFFTLLASGGGASWFEHDRNGGLVTTRRVLQGVSIEQSRAAANGETALVVTRGAAGRSLVRLAANGELRYDRPLAGGDAAVNDLAALHNGQTLLYAGSKALVLLAADGTELWRLALTSALSNEQIRVVEQDDALYVAALTEFGVFASFASAGNTSLLRVRRSDGTLQWRILTATSTVGGRVLALSPDGQRLVYGFSVRGSYELQHFDVADGRLAGIRLLPAGPASTRLTRLGSAGDLRALQMETRRDGSNGLRVDAFGQVLAPPQASAPDLRSRTGAWYDPASSGQGWFIDILADQQTLYAAWFTYDGNIGAPLATPAKLRWYSLQGRMVSGAADVQLDLLENTGGVFAAPPATQPRKVGHATLRFDRCAAVLDYHFGDAAAPFNGNRVLLQPLAIRDPGCAAAPAQQAGGFSSAASGSWFDPQTAGQGLVGVVQPPLGGSPGLVFAGWFHYDLAGAADDPGKQAWLTLQGDLPANGQGRAELGIFRTLGGLLGGESTGNTQRIGTAQIAFEDCNRMQLDYQFDDTETAMPYRAVRGVQQLRKLGDCAAP